MSARGSRGSEAGDGAKLKCEDRTRTWVPGGLVRCEREDCGEVTVSVLHFQSLVSFLFYDSKWLHHLLV